MSNGCPEGLQRSWRFRPNKVYIVRNNKRPETATLNTAASLPVQRTVDYLQPGYYDRLQEVNSVLSVSPYKEMDSLLGKENFCLTIKSQSVGPISLINFTQWNLLAMCLGKQEAYRRWNVLTYTGLEEKNIWSGLNVKLEDHQTILRKK